jgi:2,3-bisphosphoglycerate-independent phosphoglycerate mutase
VPVGDGEVVFRCNLVTVRDGKMSSYNSGHITTEEAVPLIQALNEKLGGERVRFFTGTNYRHLCRIAGREDTLLAECTPPHDIPDMPIAEFLPSGHGSDVLRDLMSASEAVLKEHPINKERESRGELPATTIWLFWGGGRIPDMPSFNATYGLDAAMTSGVDLLRGLARMMDMEILEIAGVTDGPDNDYAAQANGAMEALERHGLVVIHVEAPDEAGHAGSIDDKIEAIQKVDSEIIARFRSRLPGRLRMLIMPDHPTPIKIQTHTDAPVPFLLWGPGIESSKARAFSEAEAERTGVVIPESYKIMDKLLVR